MRILRLAAAFALTVATGIGFSACENVKVEVNCQTVAGPEVDCDVHQTEGKKEIEVCWDFSVTCKNGTKVTPPRSCAKVKDGGTTKYVIPGDKLTNADKCDSEPKAVVENLTINGEKAGK